MSKHNIVVFPNGADVICKSEGRLGTGVGRARNVDSQSVYMALTILASAVLGVAAAAVGIQLLLPAIGLMFIVVYGCFQGARSVPLAIAACAYLFLPLMALRFTASVTIGDLVLVLALVTAIFIRKPSPTLARSTVVIVLAVCAITVGGMLGTMVNSTNMDASSIAVVSFAISAIATVGLTILLNPSLNEIRILAVSFGIGAACSTAVALVVESEDFARPVGLTNHPNHLGLTCMFGAGMWLLVGLTESSRALRCLALCGAIFTAYGVVLSGSRAALVGLAAAVGLTLIGGRSRRVNSYVAASAVFCVAVVLSGLIKLGSDNAISRLIGQGDASESDAGRELRYDRAWSRIEENPILGNGFADVRFGHSLYLQTWDGAGVLGIIGVATIVLISTAAWISARKRRSLVAVVAWSSYIGYLVAAILSNQMWDRYIWAVLALALMVDMVDSRDARLSKARRGRNPNIYSGGGLSVGRAGYTRVVSLPEDHR